MKKILMLIIVFTMVVTLGACGKKNTESKPEDRTENLVSTECEMETEIESTEIESSESESAETESAETESVEIDEGTQSSANTNKPENVGNNTNKNNSEANIQNTQQENEVISHSHTYTSEITKEATCFENGIKTYSCVCGNSYTENIQKLNHVESDWKVISEATQTEDGIKQTICSNCGSQIRQNLIPCKQVYDNIVAYNAYYEEVLALVNEIRAEVGVAPLVLDYNLCVAATKRTVEMDYEEWFGHDRPDGRSCFTVIEDYGFSGTVFAENIASGFYTPRDIVTAWKSSAGHYRNMTDLRFTKMGVGYCNEWNASEWSLKNIWAQMFSD